ncbi:MAG: dihydroorotate dehydrogenase electron transfer subunit [Blautia sp.]|nr:dihydroorotate dehydrogenase electron transfer subunit [Blautia sp.]
MIMKKWEKGRILSQTSLAEGILSLWIKAGQIAAEAVPGQFVNVYSRDKSRLLPRPISLCRIDKENGRIRLVYRIAGAGTTEFSQLREGDELDLLGPLGNGFPMDQARGKKVILIGGGIGIPPLLQTAMEADGECRIVLGYRDKTFLADEFLPYGKVFLATEDGRTGTKGTVVDAIKRQKVEGDLIFACGPAPMLRAVAAYAEEKDLCCYVSMEERMACGVGACLGCICKSTEADEHFGVCSKRVCADGPVFLSTEVVI